MAEEVQEVEEVVSETPKEVSESIQLSETELTEAQTYINLIQKSYRKLESAQYAARELESDFRDLINMHVQQKGCNSELQYTLNTDTGKLEMTKPEGVKGSTNGTAEGASDTNEDSLPSEEELDPTGNFKFGSDDLDEV